MNLKALTIKETRELIAKKEISPAELHGKFLDLIKKEDGDLNCYLSLNEEKPGELPEGELTGVPLAIKDNICIEGTLTTAGSKILKNHKAVYDATVIKKLKKSGT